MKNVVVLLAILSCLGIGSSLPGHLLYDFETPNAEVLPAGDDLASQEIPLKVPIVLFDTIFESIFVNTNGLVSFQTEIPQFLNIEFPLDYPLIAAFYSNVDTTSKGRITFYQTDSPGLLERASNNVRESFSNSQDFEARNLFVVTWDKVGYFNNKSDKLNTYQIAISTDGASTFVEFLYPEGGIQWIQGTGDQSGLPDARAQAGIISAEGKLFTLPGSGTEQVRNLEKWTNMNLQGQFIYRIDTRDVQEPDLNNDNFQTSDNPVSCSQATTACHVQAKCHDYEQGFCCQCNPKYYGNGKYCVKKDVPLRVNGKVNGQINGEHLENLDLQSYIVMSDGRAYTAISRIPEGVGEDIQSLQILGGVIGYLFAKPIRNALNGYQLTGGFFNLSSTVSFPETNHSILIKQKFLGLDVFDQLKLEAQINGNIPSLPQGTSVSIDEYQEEYTVTKPGEIRMFSNRALNYTNELGDTKSLPFTVIQTFLFESCPFENKSQGVTWKLKVGKNFIRYEAREQIIRFGLSNKITPFEDIDPCDEGRAQCGPNSSCVVESDNFRCVCNPGYQQFYAENDNTIVCEDQNECQAGLHECDFNAACTNTIGSYYCTCHPGFEGDGHHCENARSCANIQCSENAQCIEVNYVARCQCLPSFTGNGQTCNALREESCGENNNCSQFGLCTINAYTNQYYCACLPGYEGDGYTCTRIPEEDTTNRIEPTTGPSGGCEVLNNCHQDAQCLFIDNTQIYACVCNEGFQGDGYHCEDAPVASNLSCDQAKNCDPHAACMLDESSGKHRCICDTSFDGDGLSCVRFSSFCYDTTDSTDCPETEQCVPAQSDLRNICICRSGYERDSQDQCIRNIETCGGGRCVEDAECVFDDDLETHYCSCKAGFLGDGINECKPKPVGCDTLNNCGLNAKCLYSNANYTYQCKCDEGFFGDGFICQRDRDCNNDPSMCHALASCVTSPEQKFVCQCNSGYIGDGTYCREKQRVQGNFLLVNQGMMTLKLPFEGNRKDQARPLQARPSQVAVGLDVDCLDGRIYWTDTTTRAIRSSTYEGKNKTDFIKVAIGSPEGIAVDWVSRNIYWTDSAIDTIEVANIDTRLRRKLFTTGLVNPRGIAVHPQRGKIFWSDWNRENPRIEWANADGTGREVFLSGNRVLLPNQLTIDFDEDKLYYVDAGTKKVEAVQIDSRQIQTIASNCSYPFGITVSENEVLWTDWTTKKIERAEKYSLKRLPGRMVQVGGVSNKLAQLKAVPNSCPQLANVCQYHKCPEDHICLPNGSGSRTCACAFKSYALYEKPSCKL